MTTFNLYISVEQSMKLPMKLALTATGDDYVDFTQGHKGDAFWENRFKDLKLVGIATLKYDGSYTLVKKVNPPITRDEYIKAREQDMILDDLLKQRLSTDDTKHRLEILEVGIR